MHRLEMRRGASLAPVAVYPLPVGFRRASDREDWSAYSARWALRAKRVFDFVGSALLLFLLSPLFVVIMAWIFIESPGSPFFAHERVGLHGRIFWILKFRTMRRRAHSRRQEMLQEKQSERLFFKHKRDPRVTPFGRFLRKFSLDELPQLINVLRGEMSLIGPRPLLKEDFLDVNHEGAQYREWSRDRHLLWPGITGLWQVSGRSELSFQESMRLDLEYVREWSLQQDLRIVKKTLPAVLAGRGAY
jgi:lipopolysaccharide/colanic/teichoic acid biosynthesis glycosyltransferase